MADLRDSTRISYKEAEALSEEVLRRWLLWALKGDPAEERIRRENMGSKKDVLCALVWIGAVS